MFIKLKKGFTLIEMIVAMALFTAVSVASVGSILIIFDANRRARSVEIILNNMNFAIEDMARSARTGTTFHCQSNAPVSSVETPQDCTLAMAGNNGKVFAFEKEQLADGNINNQIVYWFAPHPSVAGAYQLMKSESGGTPPSFVGVTPVDVVIEQGRFYVRGAGSGAPQPLASVILKGYIDQGKIKNNFALQTTITQRVPDF